MSARRELTVTRAPASRQTWAAARPKTQPERGAVVAKGAEVATAPASAIGDGKGESEPPTGKRTAQDRKDSEPTCKPLVLSLQAFPIWPEAEFFGFFFVFFFFFVFLLRWRLACPWVAA